MNVFNHTAHKALWNWLSKNQGRSKSEWPGWRENGGKVSKAPFYCLACLYAYDVMINFADCNDCPLCWVGSKQCQGSNGLFNAWSAANENKQRERASELAAQIRDLPVREGVVCK